jgi:hypothetical protein
VAGFRCFELDFGLAKTGVATRLRPSKNILIRQECVDFMVELTLKSSRPQGRCFERCAVM